MKKKNLMIAATISVCFAMEVFGEITSLRANAVQFNIAVGETKDITAGTETVLDCKQVSAGQSGKHQTQLKNKVIHPNKKRLR